MSEIDADLPERDRSSSPGQRRRWRSRSVRRSFQALLVIGLLATLTSTCVVQPFLIPSGSMESTLQVGDRVLVNKLAYRFGGPVRRGDVVVFDGRGSFLRATAEPGLLNGLLRNAVAAVGLSNVAETDYVKRVIGIGGDRVSCCDGQGRLRLNGEALDEPYLFPGDQPSAVRFDVEVPEGRLWVMGDHRSDSSDSRDYLGAPGGGTVRVDKVIGRVDWIGWPMGRWSAVRTSHG